jgi:hypothetical protein
MRLSAVAADDARVFPAPREAFLRSWISAPGHIGRALMRDGSLAAWGVIRPCRQGSKIGPLVADDHAAAEKLFASLVAAAGGEVFLDVPEPNRDAVALALAHGLAPVFETARMYTGAIRAIALDRVPTLPSAATRNDAVPPCVCTTARWRTRSQR